MSRGDYGCKIGGKDVFDGKKLRLLRQAAGLSESELGMAVGVAQNHVSQIENGYKQPSVALAKRMADKLECSVDDLLLQQEKRAAT